MRLTDLLAFATSVGSFALMTACAIEADSPPSPNAEYPGESEEASDDAELQAWEARGKLAIDWVNHSMTHPLHCAGNSCAFLTARSVDFRREVLDLEQVLLEQNETRSMFFRFPGLVHNAERRGSLESMGVLGLDANAWLAKGEPIRDGAVILLHGNGNEPAGIRAFFNLMARGPFAGGAAANKLTFVPLHEAFQN
jgi:hypothetical protein